MKFNTVIIGGGLSGLTAGIALAEAGQQVAIFSSGQSALHFNSGSLNLLGYDADHKPVTDPFEAIAALPAEHPYSRLGMERIKALMPRVGKMMADADIPVQGTDGTNHWRLSPLGDFKPAWLTFDGYPTFDSLQNMPWKCVAICGIDGFLDFYPRFLAAALRRKGVECMESSIAVDAVEHQRSSSSEMRAPNLAKVIDRKAVEQIAERLNALDPKAEAILFPAVVDMHDFGEMQHLRSLVKRPLYFAATMGASVPGVRVQQMLQRRFRRLGGAYMLGDTVERGRWSADGKRLECVRTTNFGDDCVQADQFIFAAGSFFSYGLDSTPQGVREPIFGLDVDASTDRNDWFNPDMFKPQPYMKFGLAVDDAQHARREGASVENVYVAGSALPGADAVTECSGAGIATLTALAAADAILNLKK